MKKSLILISLSLTTFLSASTNPEQLFDNKCVICHIKTIPIDRGNMVAPAINGIMRHVKISFPKKDKAVAFIIDYVQNPTKEKSICMPQKIAHFGLMPSQKENITKEELESVAKWIFDKYPSANFRGRGMMRR